MPRRPTCDLDGDFFCSAALRLCSIGWLRDGRGCDRIFHWLVWCRHSCGEISRVKATAGKGRMIYNNQGVTKEKEEEKEDKQKRNSATRVRTLERVWGMKPLASSKLGGFVQKAFKRRNGELALGAVAAVFTPHQLRQVI